MFKYFFLLMLSSVCYSQQTCKNKQTSLNIGNQHDILSLSDQFTDIAVSSSVDKSSKWSAKKMSKEECLHFIKEIEKKNLDCSVVPEILSAVDIVKADCGMGQDPQIVIVDSIPFMIEGTDLYFKWDENQKLVAQIKTINESTKKNDFVHIFTQKDLENSAIQLSKQQVELLTNLKPDELKTNPEILKSRGIISRWWGETKNNILKIAQDGQTDVYIPMIAYHDRNTYDAEKVKELNEGAYGLGVGKSIVNQNGNTELIYAMVHLDSHSQVEVNAGYGWLKNFNITDKTKVGVGYSAGLISRADIAGRVPVPFILPMASVEYDKKMSMNAVLIPKLDGGINHGNVVFIFGKYAWKK